ncbi:hypothetical protein [Candidatus Poriferisocius sp.]|uniref:hypothetical protein n=1 Tax=Candidatus Poriferisocius sp. TaxID=3101276 RepID=UPI003B01FD1C
MSGDFVGENRVGLQAGVDASWGPALTIGRLRAILDQSFNDMLVVTTGLDGAGFARNWPGNYNYIRVERAVAFAPTGVCDMGRPQALGMDPAAGVDVLAIGD